MILNYTLANRYQGYELSTKEAMLFPLVSPYAKRHWESAQICQERYRFGHKFIAILEYIPILGPLASLIERVTVFALHRFLNFQFSKPSPEEKMQKNLVKAIKEHHKEEVLKFDVLKVDPKPAPLRLDIQDAENIGLRKEMEDAHDIVRLERGSLLCVFDGHSDLGHVAKYAAKHFKKHFSRALSENPEDIRKAFTSIIDRIHQKVKTKSLAGGTTAVVSYIDDKTNIIYTATLADSEAKLYRKIDDKIYTIPLSPIRNWGRPKEAQRASIALGDPSIAEKWPNEKDAKYIRFCGVNISRAIGDHELADCDGNKGIIQKPKITMCQMHKDDLLIVACDGLWDFATEDELHKEIISPAMSDSYNGICDKAVGLSKSHQTKKGNNDNITVISVLAKKACSGCV